MRDLRFDLSAARIVHDNVGDSGIVEAVFAEGAPNRRFQARLVAIRGAENLPPDQIAKQTRNYDSHAGYLQQYQGFRIGDVELASQNYSYLSIWSGSMLGRPCTWAAVLPLVRDRSSWLLLVDDATGYPLYQGEYNVGGRLASEYCVTEFRPGAAAQIPNDVAWWTPTHYGLQDFPSEGDAVVAYGTPVGAKPPFPALANELPSGYTLALSRISTLLLNGDKTLVFDYSDGIDHLFLTEKPSPNPIPPASAGHQVQIYTDLAATLCRFEHDGIEFLAVGRGNPEPVKHLAKSVYGRAVAR